MWESVVTKQHQPTQRNADMSDPGLFLFGLAVGILIGVITAAAIILATDAR